MSPYQSPVTDLRRPSNLGLWSNAPKCATPLSDAGSSADAAVSAAAAPDRQVRSLSVRTAMGHSVSILNDDTCSSVRSTFGAQAHSASSYRHLSVPELTPDCSPRQTSRSRSSAFSRNSTKSVSPQLTPTRLPSLSALIEAVGMASYAEKARPGAEADSLCTQDRYCSHGSHRSMYPQMHSGLQIHTRPCAQQLSMPAPRPALPSPIHIHMPVPMSMPCTQSVVPRTVPAKRKYVCTFAGCGKAFTTSGHLSRHFRIHTGEKNYHCLYPGCASRFSRQDNMMQHYRTHLSPRSRRGRSARSSAAKAAADAAPSARAADPRAAMGAPADAHNSAFHPYRRTHSPPLIHLQWPFY
ncbi:transcriptional repressor [Coemansia sp. RSA 1813]|nr:transcriptional repressor [Coemansia sp. RSA 1646]KAJ1764626.1 transcriptional repressor [Coemansia sp. RSA 1843]KAJ2084991.1 transcriptional repressor [Coemansia sp. RSA 986]KAJ2210081.1 transcriptional repressor [Coemansia sp. RSA 487]KAJ2561474.1 transcriptional repressor [Coemansia sp. RSA 1813]